MNSAVSAPPLRAVGEPTGFDEEAGRDATPGPIQRIVCFVGGSDDFRVPLSDLATVPRVLVELVRDLDALNLRLAHRPAKVPPVSAVILAGEQATASFLPTLQARWAVDDCLGVVVFHGNAESLASVPDDPRVTPIDVAADTPERRRILSLALRNTQLTRELVVARSNRLLHPIHSAPLLPDAIIPTDSQDMLTGLADRTALCRRLEVELARREQEPGYGFTLLLIDVNRFKVINDSFGHGHADAVLVDLGRRIGAAVRSGDLVARLGGDEFAVVLGQCADAREAERIADRLVRHPLIVTAPDGRCLRITLSAGGVIASGQGRESVTSLHRKAGLALAAVKSRGGARTELFEARTHGRNLFERDLEPQILRALHDHEFSLYHQPIISLGDGGIQGFEALLRWHHPTLGLVPPGAFIPMLETSGLIEPLGEWIVTRACQDLRRFHERDPDIFVNVNVSYRQLGLPGFSEVVLDEVTRSGVDPRRLGVELTETSMIDDIGTVAANIDAMRAAGLRVFVDDFGVGYSALSFLPQLSADVLKIDRSFISGMTQSPRSSALVGKIVEIAHVFGLRVVAEGIETPAELEAVRSIGCDMAQGFHLGYPMPTETAERLVAERTASGHFASK